MAKEDHRVFTNNSPQEKFEMVEQESVIEKTKRIMQKILK